jgi:hypothetical protein
MDMKSTVDSLTHYADVQAASGRQAPVIETTGRSHCHLAMCRLRRE